MEGPLGENDWALEQLRQREPEQIEWYTQHALHGRSPDFIAVNSLSYGRFLGNDTYPELRDYFRALLAERFDYCIVWDRQSPKYATWIYPRKIDFLKNRNVILERKQDSGDDCSESIAESASTLLADRNDYTAVESARAGGATNPMHPHRPLLANLLKTQEDYARPAAGGTIGTPFAPRDFR